MWFLMARKLVNLSISEISSVDRGAAGDRAGRGRARVMLTKRDDDDDLVQVAGLSMPSSIAKALNSLALKAEQEKETAMKTETESDVGVIAIAKKAAHALDDGTLTQETSALLQQRLAQEMFPNDSMGVALAKFYATPHGAEMLNHAVKKNYVDLQMRTALANADVLKMRDGDREPISNSAPKPIAHKEKPKPKLVDDNEESDDINPEPISMVDKAVKKFMASGLTYDESITKVLRASRGW
jgi:hypothetical protein